MPREAGAGEKRPREPRGSIPALLSGSRLGQAPLQAVGWERRWGPPPARQEQAEGAGCARRWHSPPGKRIPGEPERKNSEPKRAAGAQPGACSPPPGPPRSTLRTPGCCAPLSRTPPPALRVPAPAFVSVPGALGLQGGHRRAPPLPVPSSTSRNPGARLSGLESRQRGGRTRGIPP